MLSGRLRTNSPPVVYETVDGETIVVNLETGSYYDLNESGGYILTLLDGESSVPELVSATATRYGIEEEVARTAVEELVARFVEEQLVVEAENGRAPRPRTGEPEAARAFASPVLNKYTDMQELLLLDPVHEVDQAGWPSKA